MTVALDKTRSGQFRKFPTAWNGSIKSFINYLELEASLFSNSKVMTMPLFSVNLVPLALTALRVLLAPVIVFMVIYYPSRMGFGICLVIAFLSDIFDGILARRLNVATPNLRRLDSIADSVFYLAAVFAAWHLHPSAIINNSHTLLLLAGLEVIRYLFDLIKFKREASYHMWSSKLWGIFLFSGFMALLVFEQNGLLIQFAIWMGIIADVEGLLISVVLKEWQSDVSTLFHALRLR